MPRSELDAWSYKAVFEDEAEQDPGYHTGIRESSRLMQQNKDF